MAGDALPTAVHKGEVLELREPEYRYGVGPVRLRVDADVPLPPRGVEWVSVTGHQIAWNGTERRRSLEASRAAIVRHAVRNRPTA